MGEAIRSDFLHLLQKHSGILHKIIRLYADDPEDRRDLYQEMLYESWRAFPAFRGEAAFSTWLYRVALNTALTFRRKALRRVALADIGEAANCCTMPYGNCRRPTAPSSPCTSTVTPMKKSQASPA